MVARYQLLDAWRGAAALAVVLFHCSNTLFSWSDGPLAQILLSGWVGVFVFFPISGYCIAAAIDRPENSSISDYLRRRWWRIFPPYWASIAVVLTVGLAVLPFNRGSAEYLSLPPTEWVAVATLTQGLIGREALLNPVYWSLCYEEQFYLVMASLLLAPRRHRGTGLLLVTLAATAHGMGWLPTQRVPGIFLNHWLEFVAGTAVYYRLHRPQEQHVAGGLVVLILAALLLEGAGVTLVVSSTVALFMLFLKPLEPMLISLAPVRALMLIGTFSYSLYLVHVPLGGRVVNLLARLETVQEWPLSATIAGTAVSLACGYVFFRSIERRFVSSHVPPSPVPVGSLQPSC